MWCNRFNALLSWVVVFFIDLKLFFTTCWQINITPLQANFNELPLTLGTKCCSDNYFRLRVEKCAQVKLEVTAIHYFEAAWRRRTFIASENGLDVLKIDYEYKNSFISDWTTPIIWIDNILILLPTPTVRYKNNYIKSLCWVFGNTNWSRVEWVLWCFLLKIYIWTFSQWCACEIRDGHGPLENYKCIFSSVRCLFLNSLLTQTILAKESFRI